MFLRGTVAFAGAAAGSSCARSSSQPKPFSGDVRIGRRGSTPGDHRSWLGPWIQPPGPPASHDEPTIAIDGEFGIRLEDCLHITEKGPEFFTRPGESIEKPF